MHSDLDPEDEIEASNSLDGEDEDVDEIAAREHYVDVELEIMLFLDMAEAYKVQEEQTQKTKLRRTWSSIHWRKHSSRRAP